MVRFKNRYILVELPLQDSLEDTVIINPSNIINAPEQRSLLAHLKEQALEYKGQLFLAKISFSLQIKYMSHGYAVIRVPRDHCEGLVASLFLSRQVRTRYVSGTIRNVQKFLIRGLRKKLKRDLTQIEQDMINKIDYS